MNNSDIVLPSITTYLEEVSGKETRDTYENLVRGLLNNKPLKGNFDKVGNYISSLLIEVGFKDLATLVSNWIEFCKEQIRNGNADKGVVTWKYN